MRCRLIFTLAISLFHSKASADALSFFEDFEYTEDSLIPERPYDVYLINEFDEKVANHIYGVIENISFPDENNYLDELEIIGMSFYTLGLVGSLWPEKVELNRMIDVVRNIEKSEFSNQKTNSLLSYGYSAIGKIRDPAARAFLKERISLGFAEGEETVFQVKVHSHNDDESHVHGHGSNHSHRHRDSDDHGNFVFKDTVRSLALKGLVSLGTKEDLTYLKSLQNNPLYSSDEILKEAIDISLNLLPEFRKNHEELVEAFIQPPEEIGIEVEER